jgi:predicted P-loop ATPase
MLRRIDKKFGPALEITRNLTVIAIKNSYHPICDYLDGLVWDGKPRINRWLIEYMTSEDSLFVRTVGELFLIAACRRVRDAGCKFDECLVLIGKEGIGKSTAIRALVPDRSWFCDSLPLGQDPKQTVEKTQGIWICESAELVGNSASKINEIKAFLSRQEDGPFRAAYEIESTIRPRQFVPIATNNDPLFLSSMHGNRRFWPVKVWHCDPDRITADRNQLWAEANIMEKLKDPVQLPKELWDEAGRQQEEYRQVEPWEDILVNLPKLISSRELFLKLDFAPKSQTPKDASRLAGVMTKKGYKKERTMIDGVRGTYYRKLTPFDDENLDHAPLSAHDQWADDMHSELRADEIAAETEPEEPDVPEGAEWVSDDAQNRPGESE